MTKKEKLAYIAGFIDGEGSISFKIDKRNNSLMPYISIGHTHLETLIWIQTQLLEYNIICKIWKNKKKWKPHWKQQYQLYMTKASNILETLKLIEPYLILKSLNSKIMREFYSIRKVKSRRDPLLIEKQFILASKIRPLSFDYDGRSKIKNLFINQTLTKGGICSD